MTTQTNQQALGDILAEEALQRVREHNQLFVNTAYAAICGRCMYSAPFTSDDIWPHVHDDPLVEPRAMGAAFRIASNEGLIRATGRWVKTKRASRHGADIREWESCHPLVHTSSMGIEDGTDEASLATEQPTAATVSEANIAMPTA